MKNLNYFNLNQIKSNPDGQTTVKRQSRVMSQSGCSAVDVPMTSYGAPDEHPMSTRSASDGTRWNSRGWKYVACMLMVLVLGIGEMWGAETSMPTSGSYSTNTKYAFSNSAVTGGNFYLAQRSSISKSSNYGWRPYNTGIALQVSSPVSLTFTIKSNTTSSRTITGQAYAVTDPFFNIYKNTTAGSQTLENYVIAVNAKSAGSRSSEEAAIAAVSAFAAITSSVDANKKLLICETGAFSEAVAHGAAISHACPTTKGATNTFTVNLSAAGKYVIYLTSSNGDVGITKINIVPRKTIYMVPGNWNGDTPKFFVHSWGDSNDDVLMTLANCETNVFKADIPTNNTNLLFTRQNPSSTEIKYKDQDGNWNQSANYSIGSNNQFTFSGTWSDGEGKSTFNAGTYSAPTFTVTYDANGGTGSVPVDGSSPYSCGSNVTILGNTGSLAKAGKAFDGWNTASGGGGTSYTEGSILSNITGDVTLFAKWVTAYSVTYNANGGSGSVPSDATPYVNGATVTVLGRNTLTKSDYVFAGWNTKSDGSGTWYIPTETFSMGTKNVTLYAQWATCISTTDFAALSDAMGTRSLDNTKSSLTSNNIKHSLGGDTRYDNSSGYHGLKLKHTGDWIGFGVAAGNTVTIKTETVGASPEVTIDFESAATLPANTDKAYEESGSARYFRIKSTDGSKAVVINKITIGTASCTAPTGLSAGSLTAKGATFTVTDGANTNNYEFYVSKNSTAPTAETAVTYTSTDKTKTVTDLVAGTKYYAWVRSKCSASNKSDWVSGGNFTTNTVTVTHTLTNVSKTSGGTTAGGSDYTAVYTADAEYSMPTPTVTIDGNTATSGTDYTWSSGTLTIPANKINGNIVITLNSADAAPSSATISGTYHYFPGDNISLTCTPTGNNGPTTYQWYKGGKADGNAIDGATSATYTKNSCAFADAGSYYCKVTCNATSIWANTNSSENYDVKILRLYVNGSKSGDPYGNVDFVKVNSTTARASISLGSNWTYGFNIADGCGHYYGNAGTMTENNCGPWVTNVNGTDCGLTTTNAATYIFTINYSNLSSITTTVTYPTSNQASGKVIYFDNNVLKWTGSSIYYRIGHSSHTQADQLSLVPGTANLYKMTTREYNSFSAWQIGNAEGGNGSDKSIYNTKNTPAITASIAYEGGAVTADAVTVTPGSDHSTGGDEQNNNCEFYSKTITDGMKRDRVTISDYSNGTITVNYTNTSNVASTLTSGSADLAHTVKLTSITAVANTGYDASAVTINGGAYSANYVVTGATTIAATFSPQVYSITYKDQGDVAFSGEHASGYPTTHTYGSSTVLKGATKAGYTFGGWYGNPECTGVAQTSIGATSITAGIILYAKWTAAASQTALVANTLYEVPDMIPSGASLTSSDQFLAGLSENTKFEMIGVPASSSTPKVNNDTKNDKTIDEITFDDGSMWFKGNASLTSNIPTTFGLSFIVPEGGGKLYLYFSGETTNIKLAKSGSEGSKPTLTDGYAAVDVTAGTYYLYGTGTDAPYCFYGMKLVTCTTPAAPTAFAAGSITTTGATFTITDAGDAASYDIYYSTSSTDPTAGTEATTTSTSKTKAVTGLTASTTYYAWVRSVCDASHKSAWVALSGSTFTTTAAPTLYTVTFDSNGGSTTPDAIEQESAGASITMPAAPTYASHTFQGWVIGGTTYAAGASYTPTANITAYASWKENCAGGGGGGTTLFSATHTSSSTMSASTGSVTLSSTSSEQVNNGIKFSGDGGYIEATGTSSFATGDVITVRVYNASGSTADRGFKLHNTSGTAHTASIGATSTADIEYTLAAADIESNGKLRILRSNSNVRIQSVTVVRPAGTCFYVTYNGNGAEAGSISDETAYTAGTSVTVSSNTGASAFTKSGYHVGSWNTVANGSGTTYALGATFNISENVTLYAQWVADACSAPSEPTISGTSVRTVGQTITLNAACATGADASTTYTWYKGGTWETKSQVQAALTAGEGGRIFNKASCVAGDAGKYWCEASNGDGCEAHNATGFTVTVNAAGEEHIYYYKDADHYDSETDTYYNPEGNTATLKDNQNLSSPWTICNACMTGVDSVVAHGATYDGKGNHMNAYIKIPTDGTATTNNVKFALSAGYTGTLTVKIGGYNSNPTVSLYKLASVNGAIDGDAVTPTSGEVGGVATTEDSFNPIVWPLSTAGGTYVLTVTSKTGYISQIDMTTSTSATFKVTYNGNGNTGGTVPTDATNYTPDATVTVAANTGDGKLVKENYTGAGWNTANNGTGTNYVPGSGTFTITANTTLYAHWTQLITLAPGAQGTGTNNAAVSWNGSVLRGFTAHTASGYALQGYYTEPSGGTKVLNADGSFAATDIDGFVTSGKWSNTGAAPTLYAQWEASNLLKWNLKVNVSETSITTLSKESAAPTVIAVANMGNLTNNGSLTITGSAKSGLTSKIATTASATDVDAGKYMSVQFVVAAGYQLVPSDIKVKVQPISHSQRTKLILEDNNLQSISYTSGSLSKGSTHTVTMTNSEEVAFTGTVTLKIYVYGTAESDGYRLGTPIEINGSVEATCATPPTYDGLSYDATEYTVGASASAISVTGAANVDTYAWKQNDVNDRSGGEAASGTNNAVSYTPPTSAAGTMYYWCEMTNEACRITIKTPAVGITVRTATTDPTVTWSNVKLNDATATPNYGGGNYVLRATVEETDWTGTLAASMITAPAGIRIHDVTTGTDESKRYIEFQFDVTTAFDRASNATIDFNLALPEAGSYSALNSVKSVSYEACTEGTGAAGMVYIPLTATQTTAKSGMQNYWETAEAGRVASNYGSTMSATYNSTGYQTAEHTFNYYAASTNDKWMFQTYVGGVNKVRVAFYAQGALSSSNLTIKKFLYDTEYFSSQGDRAVSIGEVNASQATFAAGENGYIEFTVPEMAANSYAYFVTGSSNMKIYGLVLYTENAGTGGSVETAPAWSDSKADGFEVNKTQSDANFGYTISTTTNTLGAITYSSSNPSVAAVNATTGEVTITATGASAQSAVITATLARSGCYKGATRTYTINVAGYSCSEPSGSVELTTGSATKCSDESVTLTMTGFTEGASIQWYNGESTISNGGGYTITTTATQSTLETSNAGTYSAIATSSCAAKRTNSITIANMDMSEQKTVRKVSQWYVKNGRPTPDIALWQLGEGERFKSVAWSSSNGTGLDFRTDTETGIVYLEGKEPNANETGNDIEYTLTLTVTDACGTDHALSGQTIKLTHQKNTDKHVLAFVVNGTAKGGFTEGITAAQTTSVDLYNAIAAQFDVQATNIYSTDDEQKLREYYSQYDILCITDYPNTQTKGANSKSYVDAIGALIDIRPILTMEAYVSSLSNWKLKGVSGNPKSPTTRQYTMDLQCKDHEIFNGVTTTKIGEGDEAMYRVTMVDKSQEEYKTLDANYGDGEHKANEGYQYGKKPALQGFTYTEEMSDNDLLPLGLIDDGAGNKLQVGIERQAVMEARMMVLGINSYAMERLAPDGETIVINALKYLMKKNAEDISDCSVYFDGSDETDPTNWDNELNWGPSYASLPLPHQEVRILKECVVKNGVVARASGIKIIPSGPINHNTDDASGSLTIEPGGALIVDGKVRAAVAPNYFNATPTTPANLAILASADAQGALILDNSEGETQATVQMYSKATTSENTCWQYIGIPMESLRPAQNWFYNAWMMKYTTGTQTGDEALYSWEYIKTYDELNSFNGYALTQEEAKSYWLAGALAETGVRELPLSNAGGNGWNMYANSWTAPINIAAIESSDFVNADATIYLYNTGSRANWDIAGDDAISMATASEVNTAGQYLSVPVGLAEYVGAATQIPAMQGFFVQGNHASAAGSLTLDYDKVVRTTPTEKMTTPLRAPRRAAASKTEPEHLTMIVQGSSYGDVLHLFRSDEWTDAYDNGYDAHKVYGDDYTPQLAAGSPEEELAVVATDELEGTQIRFRAGTHDSEYTIRFLYNGEDESLYLYDIQEQTYTRVETGASYTFTTNDKDAHSRFVLTRTDGQMTPTGIDDVQGDKVQQTKAKKFIMDDKMYILFNGRVFDATGKAVK